MKWHEAKDVREDAEQIVSVLNLTHIDLSRIFFYRTDGSKARAYARTWGFPKIFQRALSVQPAYVIEVLTNYYDNLSKDEQKRVLIHELLHIPKNFSGALLPHTTKHRSMHKDVSVLFKEYKKVTTHT